MSTKKEYEFNTLLPRLTEVLKKLDSMPGESSVTLVKGFVHHTITQQMPNKFINPHEYMPTIAVIGNSTGRIYLFAVKALLRDLE